VLVAAASTAVWAAQPGAHVGQEALEGAIRLSRGLLTLAEQDLALDLIEKSATTRQVNQQAPDPADQATDLADRLWARMEDRKHLLYRMRSDAQQQGSSYNASAGGMSVISCCGAGKGLLKPDDYRGTLINNGVACLIGQNEHTNSYWSSLAAAFKMARTKHEPEVLWQWLATADGQHLLEYPAMSLSPTAVDEGRCGLRGDARHRPAALAALHGSSKNVILVLNRGSDWKEPELARAAITYIVATLSATDRLGFVAAGPNGSYFPLSSDCSLNRMRRATAGVRLDVLKFINVVQPAASRASLAMALRDAKTMIDQTALDSDEVVHVLLLASPTEIRPLEEADAQNAVRDLVRRHNVVVNTYVLAEERPAEDVERFLRRLAWKTDAAAVHIQQTVNVAQAIGDYLRQTDVQVESEPAVLVPGWDDVTQRLVFSLAATVRLPDDRLAAVGLDVHADEVIADLKYSNPGRASLLKIAGRKLVVLYHPSALADPPTVPQVLFRDVEPAAISLTHGILTLVEGKASAEDGAEVAWKRVGSTPLVVVVVGELARDESSRRNVQVFNTQEVEPLLSHRLQDAEKSIEKCSNFDVTSTIQSGSLFLTQGALAEPAFGREVTPSEKQQMAYLNDRTGLLSNPGLQTQLRDDLASLSGVIRRWKAREEGEHVVGRFLASSAFYVAFPGEEMSKDFMPYNQDWYLSAMSLPDMLIISPPVLHRSGVGYSVSVSHYKPNTAAVVGEDLPLGLVAGLMLEAVPSCSNANVSCFLFDHEGKIVFHTSMEEPGQASPIEGQHLHHREPNVGKDLLLSHPEVVAKKRCKSLADRALRRHYAFNVTLREPAYGALHANDDCATYGVASVPGTNVFVGISKAECSTPPVFCPCNVNSRRCILCTDDSVSDNAASCECPCDCPLELDACPGAGMDESLLPVCEPLPAKQPVAPVGTRVSHGASLPACFDRNCDEQTGKLACVATAGCSWCQYESAYGHDFTTTFTPTKKPFCADHDVCFRGILGSSNPYQRLGREKMLRERPSRTSPVGPIVGGILVFFVFLVLSVFCYRQRVGAGSGWERVIGGRLRMSGSRRLRGVTSIEIEEDEEELKEMQMGLAVPNSPAPVAAVAVVSPYRMNPGYSRPSAGTDSDHGYSTMTPMGTAGGNTSGPSLGGGSEVAAPARDRPSGRGMRWPQSAGAPSVTSGVSSRTSSPVPSSVGHAGKLSEEVQSPGSAVKLAPTAEKSVTVLGRNQIVVAATVHVADVH